MYKFEDNYKHCLVAKINGLAAEVKNTRVSLLRSKKDEFKNYLADRKRFIGNDVRHHLLAYAFMKGKPYSSVEKKCLEEKKPSAEIIYNIVLCHLSSYAVKYGGWNLEKVQAWLKGEQIK